MRGWVTLVGIVGVLGYLWRRSSRVKAEADQALAYREEIRRRLPRPDFEGVAEDDGYLEIRCLE